MLSLRCIKVVILADGVYGLLFLLHYAVAVRTVWTVMFLLVCIVELVVSAYRVYPDRIDIRVLRKRYAVRRDAIVRITTGEGTWLGRRFVCLVTARGDRVLPGLATLPFSIGLPEVTRQMTELQGWLAERDRPADPPRWRPALPD